MYGKAFKIFVIIAVLLMAIAPFLYQSKVDVEISGATIRDKARAKPDPAEQPLHDTKLPDFASISDSNQRKQAFFDYLKPAIDAENKKLRRIRERLITLEKKFHLNENMGDANKAWLQQLATSYAINPKSSLQQILQQLLIKVDEIPKGLVLVQAANESAWGSSRFARIGLNFFGMWCFKKGCGIVPKGRTPGLNHEVAAFKTIDHMVQRYFHNLNTNTAYILFRAIRSQLRENQLPLQASILSTGLLPYSERGIDYIVELNKMLVSNARFIHD